MTVFKKLNLILLSTGKVDTCNSINWYYPNSKILVIDGERPNLYITSDDNPKEGDWCINDNKDTLYQVTGEGSLKGWNKVIATTDSSLLVTKMVAEDKNNSFPCTFNLPKIPQQFIEHFVSEYNKGNKIVDMLVEYEQVVAYEIDGLQFMDCTSKLKLNQDNTINIKPAKDSWSREEVISLIKEFDNSIRTVREKEINYRNKWIKENL